MTSDRFKRHSAHLTHFAPSPLLLLGALISLLALSGNTLAGNAILSWNKVPAASSYSISYGTAPGRYTKTQKVANRTKATVKGLKDGTRYYFALRAHKGSKSSAYSNEVSGIIGAREGAATETALVAAFGFNETAGTQVTDSSGNANHGTLLNATRSTNAKFGSALSFSGNNSLVTVKSSASLNLTHGMTLSAWVYPTAVMNGWKSLITKERTGGLAYALHANSNTNKPNSTLFIGSANRPLNAGSRLPTNQWTHLATTFDGSTHRLYVNGVQVGSRAQSGLIATSVNPLQIGGSTVVSGRQFTGLIDEVRIYNGPISQAEIIAQSRQAIGN